MIIETTFCVELNSLHLSQADIKLIFNGGVEPLAVIIFVPLDKQSKTDHPNKSVIIPNG